MGIAVKVAKAKRSSVALKVKSEAVRPKSRTKSSKDKATSRSERTFSSESLEALFLQFCQLSFACSKTEPISVYAKRWSVATIELIGNKSFDSPSAESEILGNILFGTGLVPVESSRSNRVLELPSHLARLCETKLLTPPEEAELFRRMNYLRHLATKFRDQLVLTEATEWEIRRIEGLIGTSNWYRDLIVKSNMRLVISIVKKFVNNYNGFDDLLSDGIMALMRAVDKFDYGMGFRFSTYATQVVRRNAYRTVMQKQKERGQASTSIDESGIDVCDRDSNSSMSLERWNDLRTHLGGLLEKLDRREKFIVRARFSLGGHRRVQTLQRLADKLGVSKERVRQLEMRALEKLREMASQSKLPGIEV